MRENRPEQSNANADTGLPDAGGHANLRLWRVAFQGELGAFSELAVRMRWNEDVDFVTCRTFADTVDAVLTGAADFAVIPVENAIAGVVVAARAALDGAGAQLQYLGELLVPVHLCFMAPHGASINAVRMVHSHQMALAQCQRFFAKHPWLIAQVHDDTAGAARDVAAAADLSVAAIAADAAATRYGLEILSRDIQDVSNNWTRFVVVQKATTNA